MEDLDNEINPVNLFVLPMAVKSNSFILIILYHKIHNFILVISFPHLLTGYFI